MGDMKLPNEVPVLLMRSDEDKLVALTVEEAGSGWRPILGEVGAAAAGLLTARRSKGVSGVSGRIFNMRQEDLEAWDNLIRRGKDGYAYATLWRENGQISRQAMIKELPAKGVPAALDPLAIATLAATVQIQASIEQLREAVANVGEDVKEVLEFLHTEQEADVLAALDTIHGVYLTYAQTGQVGTVDWDRVSGLEHILKKHHRQVLNELDSIRVRMEFNCISKAAKSMQVKEARVRRLIALEYHLLWAMGEWTEVMLVAKTQRNELTPKEASNSTVALDKSQAQARAAVRAVHEADAGKVQGRAILEQLRTDGLVFGARKDNQVRNHAIENREEVREVTKDTAALEPVSASQLILVA